MTAFNPPASPVSPLSQQIISALGFAQGQVRRLIEAHPGFYPLYTHQGKWKHDKPAWTRWCDGFLPGMMWLFLESGHADDAAYWRGAAEKYSAALEERKEDRDVHDLGFIFYHGTYKRWYDATAAQGKPDAKLHEVVIRAGQVLAMRFKEKGNYLRSFISDESLFIDIMMNVPVIFYAAKQTDDAKLLDVAMKHSLTTRRTLVRGDGSTSHEGIFDLKTGEFLRQTTHQGYRGDSAWSRGLAWSLYGFGTCHELSGDARFLDTAEQNAEFYLESTPAGGIPPWDYDAPQNGPLSITQPDSSAAAIAACGLFNLARLSADRLRATAFRDAALNIVNTLTRPPYLASKDPGWEGILKRGVYHIHKQLGVDESVMWGEFFFVEAMTRALAALKESPAATESSHLISMPDNNQPPQTVYEPPDEERPASSAAPPEDVILQYAARPPAIDPYAAFRYRDFCLYMLGWIVGVMGDQVLEVAIGWDIYQRTHNALSLGWVGLVTAIPVVALALHAGQLADLMDRRKIVFYSQFLRSICIVLLAWVSYQRGSIGVMYALLFVASIGRAIAWPARSALMPSLVPPEVFPNAINWNSSGFQIASMAGPAFGGFLILWSVPAAYVVAAICGVIFAAVLIPIKSPPQAKSAARTPGNFRTLAAGVHFVLGTKIILATITLDLFAVLLGGATYLLPIFATDRLHVGAVGFGWLRAAPALGALAMGIAVAHMPPMKHAGRAMLWAVAGFGVATIFFGLSTSMWLSLVMLFLTGAFDNVSVLVRHTLVQVLTPDEMRGRVSAVNNIFIGASNELGGFESGFTAHLLGPDYVRRGRRHRHNPGGDRRGINLAGGQAVWCAGRRGEQ